LPAGYHLNPAAPQRYKVSLENAASNLLIDEQAAARTGRGLQLPVRVPLKVVGPGAAELRIQMTLYYCREDNTGTCRIKTLVLHSPVEVTTAQDAASEIKAEAKIED
jgi:hypothetical protein